MATADLTKVFRVPGRLAIGATNLATAYPHGGTALGVSSHLHAEPTFATQTITEEAYGREVIDVLYLGESWIVGGFLRQTDDDAWDTIFPNTSTGSSSGQKVIEHPGTVRAGTMLSTRGVVLTFTPNDQTNHPGFIARRAIPLLEETARLRLTVVEEFRIQFVFACVRPASGNAIDVGLIEDLSV